MAASAQPVYSLEKRRERGDLIETFKMLKGLERVDSSKFFQLTDSNSRTRGHPLKIYKSSLKKNLGYRKHFFSQRVVNSWNALPEAVVNAKTVSAFKRELDSHWKEDMIKIWGQKRQCL